MPVGSVCIFIHRFIHRVLGFQQNPAHLPLSSLSGGVGYRSGFAPASSFQSAHQSPVYSLDGLFSWPFGIQKASWNLHSLSVCRHLCGGYETHSLWVTYLPSDLTLQFLFTCQWWAKAGSRLELSHQENRALSYKDLSKNTKLSRKIQSAAQSLCRNAYQSETYLNPDLILAYVVMYFNHLGPYIRTNNPLIPKPDDLSENV